MQVHCWPNNRLTIDGNEKFISGMNIAWINFARDIADDPLDENKMRTIIQDVRDAGGNALRWWLYTDAQQYPLLDDDGKATAIGAYTIANIKTALDIAQENGVVFSLCLLSFDLMQEQTPGDWHHQDLDKNYKMLTTDAGIDAFVDVAVRPVVKEIGNHPAIMSWEVFNEPEGMTEEFGWTARKVKMYDVQRVVNRVAAAVHEEVPGVLVSNGSHSMWANSDVLSCGNCKNYYSDAELIAAGGKNNGTLDFYQVHYYPEHFDDDRNPFAHPASYWGLDKPIVIGEFPADSWDKTKFPAYRSSMNIVDAFAHAYDEGYAGALSWDITGFTDGIDTSRIQNLETSAPAMTALFEAHEADVKIKDVVREDVSDKNGVMEVGFNITQEASLERVNNYDWSGKTNLIINARVIEGDAFKFRMVMKTGDSWDWKQSENFCTVANSTEWTKCEIPLDGFTAWDDATNKADLSNVKSLILQSFEANSNSVVQFDDISVDGEVFDDFNVEFDLWAVSPNETGKDKNSEQIVAPKTVYISAEGSVSIINSNLSNISKQSITFKSMASDNGFISFINPSNSKIKNLKVYSLVGKNIDFKIIEMNDQVKISLDNNINGVFLIRAELNK